MEFLVRQCSDEHTFRFFRNSYPKLPRNAFEPIVLRIGRVLDNEFARAALCDPRSSLDFRRVMDEGKIALLNLSDGLLGWETCQLIGSLLVSQFQLAVMSRADTAEAQRRPFTLRSVSLPMMRRRGTPWIALRWRGSRGDSRYPGKERRPPRRRGAGGSAQSGMPVAAGPRHHMPCSLPRGGCSQQPALYGGGAGHPGPSPCGLATISTPSHLRGGPRGVASRRQPMIKIQRFPCNEE
jgi:hypothetical protein